MKKTLFILSAILSLAIPAISYAALGDLLYGTANPSINTRLTIGANGNCLTSNGSIPGWSASCGSGGSSFSTTSANYWLVSTSSPLQAGSITATSTSATSTFAGNVQAGGTFLSGVQGLFSLYNGQVSAGGYPASSTAPTVAFQVPEVDWLLASTSPTNFGWQEGWSEDATYNYGDSQNFLGQYTKDATWSNVTSNSNPTGTGGAFYTHLGGIKTPPWTPFIWTTAENYLGCPTGGSNESIVLFSKTTGLPFVASTSISSFVDELSGLAFDQPHSLMFTSTFCTPGKIFVFSVPNMTSSNAATALSGMAYLGYITVSPTIPDAQDLEYVNGMLYVSGSTDNAHMEMWQVNPLTGQSSLLLSNLHSGEPEGIAYDYQNGVLGFLTNSTGLVYFLKPTINTVPTAIFDTNTGSTTIKSLHTLSTTTANYGFNLSSGCFAILGTCVGGGSGSGTVNSGTIGNIAVYTGSTAVSDIATSTVQTGLKNGLILDMSLDEGTGSTTYDFSPNRVTGTLCAGASGPPSTCTVGASPVWAGNGKFGNAIYFPPGLAAGDLISDPNDLYGGLAQMSVSAWFLSTSTLGGQQNIITKHYSGVTGTFSVSFNNSTQLQFFTQDQGGTRYTSTYTVPNISDSKWHHVAVEYDGTNQNAWLDGVALTCGGTCTRSGATQTGTYSVEIGTYNQQGSVWVGDIDDVKIWNRALNTGEVETLYSGGNYFNSNSATIAYASTTMTTATTASTTNLIVSSAGGSGTRCLQAASDGTVSANASACGTGGGGANTNMFATTTGQNAIYTNVGQNLGVGTSSPWAALSVGVPTYSATAPMFAIGSSTSSGTTTPFMVSANGDTLISTTNGSSLWTFAHGGLLTGGANAAITLPTNGTFTGGLLRVSNGGSFFANSNNPNSIILQVLSTNQTSKDMIQWIKSSPAPSMTLGEINNLGYEGIGTTSPFAILSISATSTAQLNNTVALFAVATSTGTASTTVFEIDKNGHAIINNAAQHYGTDASTAIVCYMSDGSLGYILESNLVSGNCTANN